MMTVKTKQDKTKQKSTIQIHLHTQAASRNWHKSKAGSQQALGNSLGPVFVTFHLLLLISLVLSHGSDFWKGLTPADT